jgi:hypothetical protein
MEIVKWVQDVLRETIAYMKSDKSEGIYLKELPSKKKAKTRKKIRLVKKLKKAA